MQGAVHAAQSSNFDLKNRDVELMPRRRSEPTFVAVTDLEALRTERAAVPASKHGLETICGASCETGAQ